MYYFDKKRKWNALKVLKRLMCSLAWELLVLERVPVTGMPFLTTCNYLLHQDMFSQVSASPHLQSVVFPFLLNGSWKSYTAGWSAWNSSWVVFLGSFPTRHCQLLLFEIHTSNPATGTHLFLGALENSLWHRLAQQVTAASAVELRGHLACGSHRCAAHTTHPEMGRGWVPTPKSGF